MGIFRGIAYITSDGMPVSIQSEAFLWLGTAAFWRAAPIWIFALLLLVNHFVLRQDRVRAQGLPDRGNVEAAVMRAFG